MRATKALLRNQAIERRSHVPQPSAAPFQHCHLTEPAVPVGRRALMLSRKWAEEHWEAASMIGSLLCAVIIAVILAVTFNVVSTELSGR